MNFKDFKKDVESAFNNMIAENLFVVSLKGQPGQYLDLACPLMFMVQDMILRRWDFLEQKLFSNTSKLRLQTMWIAELMLINLLTLVCNLNKLTVFDFEFNI